mmetsp:Transcript_33056/g.72493  ORF Transcript_33056/g.72493 Transcript_33056/m.72493 type:complete len:204 (-) Transcript_33056:1454-2065(-)
MKSTQISYPCHWHCPPSCVCSAYPSTDGIATRKQAWTRADNSSTHPRYERISRARTSRRGGSGAYGHSGRDKSTGPLPGCDALCWSVQQWHRSSLELLKSSPNAAAATPLLTRLNDEWDQARTDMRFHAYGTCSDHCLVVFGDMIEYCREVVVSGVVSDVMYPASREELALLIPTCKRFLHAAKAFEHDAVMCLLGESPETSG